MKSSKFKKTLAMLLMVCLVFDAMPMTIFAEDAPFVSGVEIIEEDGGRRRAAGYLRAGGRRGNGGSVRSRL
ncbi:MAG: hypothetical protein LBV08_02375 [Clostridiales bacterium]|nr:hypothetical protein [Clostridiales bacterium]